jgi:hypothetical protein
MPKLSGFDALKDLTVEDFGFVPETNIHVSVKSYSGGEAKVDLKREFSRKNGDTGFSPLGRLSIVEAIRLAQFLTEKVQIPDSLSEPSDEANAQE